MGDYVKDSTTSDILVQLNKRFDADGLPEMISVCKRSSRFSPQSIVAAILALLGIVPADAAERQGWFHFLDQLHKYKSDLPNVTGHDRWVKVIQKNLESAKPVPLATTAHAAADDLSLKVTQGKPLVYSSDDHIIGACTRRSAAPPTTRAPRMSYERGSPARGKRRCVRRLRVARHRAGAAHDHGARLWTLGLAADPRAARRALPRPHVRQPRLRGERRPAGSVHRQRSWPATRLPSSTRSVSSARTSSARASAARSRRSSRFAIRCASSGSCSSRRCPACRTCTRSRLRRCS